VHVGVPGQARMAHLGGHQRAGRLGCQQQGEAVPLRRRGEGRELTVVLGDRVEPVGRIRQREEGGGGGRHRLKRVPARGLVVGKEGPVDER
jgi:hypothetical protein